MQSVDDTNHRWYSPRFGVDPLFTPFSQWVIWFKGMSLCHKLQFVLYIIIWLGAFLYTQIYWVYTDNNFRCDIFGSIGASSITYDLIFVLFAVLLWIFGDFFFMGFSVYTYILTFAFSFLTAVSVTTPLYLLMRLLRVSAQSATTASHGYVILPGVAHTGTKEGNSVSNERRDITVHNFIPFILYLFTMYYWHHGPTPFPPPELCEE